MDRKQGTLEKVVKIEVRRTMENFDLNFYKGKKVFITGHTGFKGSWLSALLLKCGADVIGYSLEPEDELSLWNLMNLKKEMKSITGDIRDFDKLNECVKSAKPDIILHLAAQPIVKESYKNPRYTYDTNVMGTVNILECVRLNNGIQSFLNVTTDKVYKNNEWIWGYRENDILGGFDPYSNSKSCSELVTESYKNSFFTDKDGRSILPISTARAGNVIGGGDFARDRIIPDCVRAVRKREAIIVRNPYSIRPYQHVLEPLYVYLMIAAKQIENPELASNYNVGPEENDCCTTGELVDLFVKKWGENSKWIVQSTEGPHEAGYLKLDCSKVKNTFGWRPSWNIEETVEKVVEWYREWNEGKNIGICMDRQIEYFLSNVNHE